MAEPGEAAAPTCYRHRDRETYVSCTRCDRPICPECMLPASVGFQCPDCVREGSKSVRQARTPFGGRVVGDAVAVKVLIGINVVCFLLQQSGGGDFTLDFALISRAFDVDSGRLVGIAQGDYYRLLSAAFLHANVIHIAFNMYALFAFGSQVELLLGRGRFIALYLASALGGSVLSYTLHSPRGFIGVGASGAVFGLFGAFYVIAKGARADTSQIVGLIAINLVLGFAIAGIDNYAHIGGLVTGAALTWILAKVPRGAQRTAIQSVAIAGIVLLLSGLAVVRTQQLRDDPTNILPISAPAPDRQTS